MDDPRGKNGGDGPRWAAATGWYRRHLRLVTALLVIVTLALAPGLTRLRFSTSQDTLVDSSTDVYRTNGRYQRQFGGEVMVVLYQGRITNVAAPRQRAQLVALEHELARTPGIQTIISPTTVLGYAADQVKLASVLSVQALGREQAQAAEAVRARAASAGASPTDQAAAAQRARDELQVAFQSRVASDATRLSTVGNQSLANPRYVEFLLFDEHGNVRPALQGAFPDGQHALMVIRLQGNTSIDQQSATAKKVTEIAAAHPVTGFTATTTGSAALLAEINDRLRSDLATTGALAVGVMAAILLIVLRARWRLLSLGVMAVGITWAFGLVGYFGIPLTMVTISALPILIGLAVDFAIQLHCRYEEETGPHGGDPLARTVGRLGPALAVAAVAAVTGFLALRLSSVPMIRDFGVLLSIGIAASFLAVSTVTPAVLVWRDRRFPTTTPPRARRRPWRQRDDRPADRRRGIERVVQALTAAFGGHITALALVAAVLVGGGLWAQHRTPVQSDPERFVPQDSQVLRDLRHLRDVAGTSADMGIFVEADDVTRPDVLAWMANYEARALRDHPGEIVSSSSIASITETVTGAPPTPSDTNAVLAITPPDLQRMFVSSDRTKAQILFPIGHLSLDQQKQLLGELRGSLHPPPGVRVNPAGLSVIGIAAVDGLKSNQTSMVWVAAGAIFVWLTLAFRTPRRAALTLVPVLTAVGASALLVDLFDIQVSALGALSSPLVVAIGTEFSVLIVERYVEERRTGRSAADAIDTASLRIGRAFSASGLTVAGGFAALALSGFPLLTSFGIVVALNVIVTLTAVLVVLPPMLMWDDRRTAQRAARQLGASRARGLRSWRYRASRRPV